MNVGTVEFEQLFKKNVRLWDSPGNGLWLWGLESRSWSQQIIGDLIYVLYIFSEIEVKEALYSENTSQY